jgi:hypothetical protein
MPKARLLVAALVFFLGGRVVAATAKPAKAAAAANAQPSRMSDADLQKAIQARFSGSKISSDKFTAHVSGGIATLEGYTEVVQHKGTATRLAKSAGALAVINNIQISQAAKDKAQANLESGRRRAQVKRTDSTVARSQK